MDTEKVCSVVEGNEDRMTVHTLCTPKDLTGETQRAYCVLGLCFKEVGVPDDLLEDRSGPGDVYVPVGELKEEVVEELPGIAIREGDVEQSWLPDEDWVSGKSLLKYVYNMRQNEWDALIAANDEDTLSTHDIPEGETPAERVMNFLKCEEALHSE